MMRTKLFWLIWLVVGIVGLCMMSHVKVHGATQGDGARLLVRWAKVSRMPTPPLPPATAAVRAGPAVREEHFAATATGVNGLESDFSAEAVLVITNRVRSATCAWDPPTGTNRIAHYTLYHGRAEGTYTNSVTTTNTQATIRVNPPVPTNLVLTVTSVGLTNIAWRDGWKGSWRLLGATNLCVTNPVATSVRLYRGLGRPATAVKRLYWQSRLQ